MKLKLTLVFAALFFASAARADSQKQVVTIDVRETTVLNGSAQGSPTGIPLTLESPDEILSIAIDWAATGTPNAPFPAIYGAEDAITLDYGFSESVCNYLSQTGPSSYQAIDCGSAGLQAPYVSSVTYSGNWGSAEIGFGGTEPITIDSTFTEQTITPEPSLLLLSGISIALLCLFGKLKIYAASN